ncbi:hypothetical protein ZL54_22530 [Salmonella enterica subsp. enterica]|nr:hypothetical protein [Salmonella enterica subsp. enterica]EEJ7209115.1 hypothetical protein [Salmonella enterica subsp. enterica]
MVKPRSSKPAAKANDQQIKELEKMADQGYAGTPATGRKDDNLVRRSVAMTADMFKEIERLAGHNKIEGVGPSSLNAIVREALTEYLAKNKPGQ